jgi:hypothetical protein
VQRVSRTVQALTRADQVYVCLWSHAGWQPGHIHFVVQGPGTSGAGRLAVLAPLCRRRCFKLEMRRQSKKSRRSAFK